MILVVILLALGAIFVVGAASTPSKARAVKREEKQENDFETLIRDDPAAALARYGTPETAAELKAQGIDLGALGYRPDDG